MIDTDKVQCDIIWEAVAIIVNSDLFGIEVSSELSKVLLQMSLELQYAPICAMCLMQVRKLW